MVQSKKYKIYIASFGYRDVIQFLIDACGLTNHIEDIFTGKSFEEPEGRERGDKNDMLALLLPRAKDRTKKILLVDDSTNNIEAAREEGYHVFKVDPDNALTREDADTILNILDTNSEITTIVFDADLTLFNEHITAWYVYEYLDQKGRQTFGGQARASQLIKRITDNPCNLFAEGSIYFINQLKPRPDIQSLLHRPTFKMLMDFNF